MYQTVKKITVCLWRDLRRLHTIVYLAVAFLTGVKCGYNLIPYKTALWLWSIALLLFLLIICFRRQLRNNGLLPSLIMLFFLIGATRSSRELWLQQADLNLARSLQRPVVIECRIEKRLSVKRLKGRAARYRFSVRESRLLDNSRRLALPLSVNWYGDHDESNSVVPMAGELWRFKGRLYPSEAKRDSAALVLNSGENSSARLSGIRYEVFQQRLEKIRSDALQRVTIGIQDWKDVAAIHRAVLLGSRENMPGALKNIFICSGTIHVFAISGLHVALIASIFVAMVSCCGLPRYHWLFVLVPLLFVYTLITGMRPSAMRASLMAILFFCAPCFHRQFNTLTALAAAALIVHFFRPAFITDIGSILSFSVMLGLIALYKPFNALFLRMMRAREIHAEAILLKAADDFSRARNLLALTRLIQFSAGLCAVTIAAWLASMPLSAYFFGRVTPGGILANLIISPCAFMLVVAGVIGYAVSFVSLTLAAVFNNAAAVFTTIMIKTAALVSSMPFSNFKVDKFSSWAVWFWFALLLISAWCLRKWIEKCDDGLDWMGER